MGNIQVNRNKKKIKKLNNPSYCTTYDNINGYNLCHQPYALCTSAKCYASSQDPSIAICNCPIKNGCSMGNQECSTLQPFTSNGVNYIYSTFNPSQVFKKGINLYKYNSTKFANCLNKQCTIDPLDPNTALCQCSLTESNDGWVAFGQTYNIDPNVYLSGDNYNNYKSTCKFFKPLGIKLPKRPVN